MNEVIQFSPTEFVSPLWTCEECFAVVHEDNIHAHIAWHYPPPVDNSTP